MKGERNMNFRFEKSGGFGLLSFDGELTVECADRLKEALMVSMDNAEHLVISFKNVTKIDCICLRLFCNAYRKSERLRKRLTLTGISPEMYKRVEEFIGYNIPITCPMSGDVSSIPAAG